MEKHFEMNVRLTNGEIEIDLYEPESGEAEFQRFPYSPDEHPEFNEIIGNLLYMWLDPMADSEEENDDDETEE